MPAYSSPLAVTADKVHLITEPKADNGEHTEASGVVSNFVVGSPATFTVDGLSVSADGTLAAGVANGVMVEVKGTMQGGVLVALKVKVEIESTIKAKGQVTAVDTTAGTITLDGVLFAISSRTIFRDTTAAGASQFGLAGISAGNTLEVSGCQDPVSGAAIATRVEKQSGPGETVLSAPVTAAAGSTLTLAGVSVDISGLSNAAALLAAITPGSEVTVKGTVIGTTFTATQGSIGG